MASANVRCIITLNILLAIISVSNAQIKGAPPVKIQAFKHKGFRAYIDHIQYLDVFVIHGNVNQPIQLNDVGMLSGEAHRPTDGKWIVEDTELQLKVGDVINYYVFVSFETAGYLNNNLNYVKDNQTYTVTELEEQILPASLGINNPVLPECEETLTKILDGRTVCAGHTIFEDNFDIFRDDVWQIEHYIPIHHNGLPFVTYQQLPADPRVTVLHGNLQITPKLQQDVSGFNEESITSGTLNLVNGCTSDLEECFKEAKGDDILPPIVSGRVISKGFAFKYGTIYVRAKFPMGDWLYPELMLEPFHKNKYGRSRYSSGSMSVACAKGNTELNTTSKWYGGRSMYGGLVMSYDCINTLLISRTLPQDERWRDEFRVYSLRWDPDGVTLTVDGKQWGRIEPGASGLVGLFPEDDCKDLQRELFGYRSKLAPFDDYFYLVLGVAAGGSAEFPDNSHTGTSKQPKPWTNNDSKAMLNFWKDLHNWIATWDHPELLVDYIRVEAL